MMNLDGEDDEEFSNTKFPKIRDRKYLFKDQI
jgi:hypothetical protein